MQLFRLKAAALAIPETPFRNLVSQLPIRCAQNFHMAIVLWIASQPHIGHTVTLICFPSGWLLTACSVADLWMTLAGHEACFSGATLQRRTGLKILSSCLRSTAFVSVVLLAALCSHSRCLACLDLYTVQAMDSLQGVDFEDVASVLDERASFADTLRSARVSAIMKGVLRMLGLVESSVATTEAARVDMRHKLVGLRHFFGAPVVFLTINPADPFTLRFANAVTVEDYRPHLDADSLLAAHLRSCHLAQLVARDPAAAVRAFTHV